jgi:hypothetical protein
MLLLIFLFFQLFSLFSLLSLLSSLYCFFLSFLSPSSSPRLLFYSLLSSLSSFLIFLLSSLSISPHPLFPSPSSLLFIFSPSISHPCSPSLLLSSLLPLGCLTRSECLRIISSHAASNISYCKKVNRKEGKGKERKERKGNKKEMRVMKTVHITER